MTGLCYDYVIVGGGPSGCYLAALLHEKFPDRTICLINKDGFPGRVWKTYMLNLVGVAIPWLVPSFEYRFKSHKSQFVNSSHIGGNTNINAAVCPMPTDDDITNSLGSEFVQIYHEFCKSKELDRISRPAPVESGLERLSQDLNNHGVHGGRIRVFSDGFRRIHPADFIERLHNLTVTIGLAKKLVIDTKTRMVQGVVVATPEKVETIVSKRKVFLCGGALESPKLLIQSGCGPKEIVERYLGPENLVVANEHIGTNLQEHWVGRASAKVPSIYEYSYFYPVILGYKHRFKNVAMGFGKLQLMGKNMLSFATTKCRNPGRIILTSNGSLEPYLNLGPDDIAAYQNDLAELTTILKEQLGIEVQNDEKRASKMSPNWHLCCSVGLEACCDPSTFELKELRNLVVGDLSILKEIIHMNTQIMSYFIPYVIAQREG